MLEAEQPPEPGAAITFIERGLKGLGVESIDRVQVFGRQVGEEFPVWNYEFSLSEPQVEVIEPVQAVEAVVAPETEAQVRCPRCSSTQIMAGKKGFGLGKAVAGAVLLGPLGLAGGLIGSGQVMLSCLKCGHQWEPAKINVIAPVTPIKSQPSGQQEPRQISAASSIAAPGDNYTRAEPGFLTDSEKLEAATTLFGGSLFIAFLLFWIPAIGKFLALLMVALGIWSGYYVVKVEKVKYLKGQCPYCSKKLNLALDATQAKCPHCQGEVLVNDRKFYVIAK